MTSETSFGSVNTVPSSTPGEGRHHHIVMVRHRSESRAAFVHHRKLLEMERACSLNPGLLSHLAGLSGDNRCELPCPFATRSVGKCTKGFGHAPIGVVEDAVDSRRPAVEEVVRQEHAPREERLRREARVEEVIEQETGATMEVD